MGLTGSKKPTHHLGIVTGDIKGASAKNIDVSLKFTDETGRKYTQTVTEKWNVFIRGYLEIFKLELLDLGKVVAIEICWNDSDNDDVWYVERVEVDQISGEEEEEMHVVAHSVFPINRWIKANSSLTIQEYDSLLPKADPNSEQREKELRAKREKYMLSGKIIGVPPQVEILPKDEVFSFGYQFFGDQFERNLDEFITKLNTRKFTSLEDMESIYSDWSEFPFPKGFTNWRSDEEFGQQKLTGCNPVLIELCTDVPDHIPASKEVVSADLLEDKTIEDAVALDRIYMIDLRYMADIECSQDRKLPGPTCLFYQRDNGDLVPIAIQLMPEPAEDNPVFTPSDPEYTWLAAKMWFNLVKSANFTNLADCSHHQSATHLGFTHLLMESVAVCTNRRLSPSHPIYKLLAPHFRYIMAINWLASASLAQPGGWVDKAMHIGRAGMFNIIRKKWAEWNLTKHGNFAKDLERRGVDKEGTLPNYHFRDDALLLWQAIKKYVTSVVNGVYDAPEKMKEDEEIQDWVKELTESAKFKGLPEKFTSNEELIEVVTVFIFISKVGHAAANFEQYDQYAFPPNYPSIIHGERPKTKEALSQQYVVECLPTKRETLDVMEITRVLSQKATNSLGHFEVQYAYDPNAVQAMERFQADLAEIEVTIKERNEKRTRKYFCLEPSQVPNSIIL